MSAARKRAVKAAQKTKASKAAIVGTMAAAAAVAAFGFAFVYHTLTNTWPAAPVLSMLYVFAFVASWLVQRLRFRLHGA